MWKYAAVSPSGEIVSVISGGTRYVPVLIDDEISDETHYVNADDEIRDKRRLEITHAVSGMTVTLENLPAGLTVATNCMATITDDTPLLIEYDLPGTYEINFSGHVEYLEQTLEVTIDDA